MSRGKRDEWSCPCCGVPTDSSYCAACEAFECGERDRNDPNIETCLVPDGVECQRARHAAHYEPTHPKRGHDLLIVEVVLPAGRETPFDRFGRPEVRPAGLPFEFSYHSGSRTDVEQRWRFVRIATLSAGYCAICRPLSADAEVAA